ncbi:MarR family winged helix-turn-helix transcriptional regulator [Pseudarthrobacter polychromogenes]
MHGLQPGEFDVLATLRRSGDPFRMTVAQLLEGAMVTSGAITNRLNRLTDKGLIEREIDPLDRRSVIVTLTPKGRVVLDGALSDHVDNERFLLAALNPFEQDQLARLLRQLLIGLGDGWEDTPPKLLTEAPDASVPPA